MPTHPFSFTGTGSEFFRIWIVNLTLSIVTLGIYSAWAKVRSARYFYGNTRVAGDSFEYHAEPLTILKGRVIAIALLIAYVLTGQFLPTASLVLVLLVTAAAPWFIVRALRFRAVMSSWRNVRFGFEGSTGAAYGTYIFAPLLAVITLGLALPWVWYVQSQYVVDNHRYGKSLFRLRATAGQFYTIALILSLVGIVFAFLFSAIVGGVIASSGIMEQIAEGDGQGEENPILLLAMVVPMMLFYAVLYALYKGLRFRAVYNNLQLRDNRIDNSVSMSRYIWISLTNGLAILLTLGLYYPWARVRMSGYLVNSMTLHAADLDSFVNDEASDPSALGEEFGEAFDVGFGV